MYSSNSSIAKSALILALRKRSGGGGDPSPSSENPYQYALKQGITSLSQSAFDQAWKESLNPKPFSEQFLSYLQSIGYTSDINQVNKWMLKLVNGELESESFYQYITSLVDKGKLDKKYNTENNIDKWMVELLSGNLTMQEFYNNLTSLGYKEKYDVMQERIYYLFTEEFVNKEDLENASNPYTYAKDNNLIPDEMTKEEFNKNYSIAVNNTYIYEYAKSLIPTLTNAQINKIMLDLFSGRFYNKTLYDHLVDEYYYEGDEATAEKWILALVNGELESPWMLAQRLGSDIKPPQTQEEFEYMYKMLLVNYTIDGGGNDKYPGDFEIPEPNNPENLTLYQLYQKYVNYQGTEQELYEALYTLAYMMFSGGSAQDDKYDLGADKFEGDYKIPEWPTFTQKTLYELYKDIAVKDNVLTESEFTDKFNDYMLSFLPQIVEGGGAFTTEGGQKFPGDYKIPELIDFTQKSLYELYKDIGLDNSITEKEFENQLLRLAYGELSNHITGGDAFDGIGNDIFNGDFDINSEEFQSVYQWFQSAGYHYSETELKEKMMALAVDNDLPYRISGGNAIDTGANFDDKYYGDFKISELPSINQKTLYELYIDIANNENVLSESAFNERFNAYMQEIINLDGTDAEGKPNDKVYDGVYNNNNFYNLSLYQLFQDCGLNPNDISEDDFNQKMVDFAGKSNFPYGVSGGNSDNSSWGGEIFEGDYKNNPNLNQGFFEFMLSAGYRFSLTDLQSQMIELLNYSLNLNIDGGGSNTPDATQEVYDGPIPEARNAVLDYLISQGFDPTPENVKMFNLRFKEFAEGNLVATSLDGN